MSQGPLTFRDHFLSIYQSAVADLARQAEGAAATESVTVQSPLIAAAERVATLRAQAKTDSHEGARRRQEGVGLERLSPIDHAQICASLGLRYLEAKLAGDETTRKRIEDELLTGSKCDPRWARTLDEYFGYFGPGGTRRQIPYVRPGKVGSRVLPMKATSRIGLIGDWGTGAEPARRLLRQLKEQAPDIIIHLGDIYYSGTEKECRENFHGIVDRVLDRPGSGIAVYTLSGNHDMYSGGKGYYGLLKGLNPPAKRQTASFFCLRAEDDSWQLLGLDTGLHDYSPVSVSEALTFLEPEEEDWHEQRIREFPGKTILLSHHQLFSAFSSIGKPGPDGRYTPFNPRLKASLDRFQSPGREIAAWFWGHEHNLCIYQPFIGLKRGRCVGHSAIPVSSEDDPYEALAVIGEPPRLVEGTKISKSGEIYHHGFALLSLGRPATVAYFQDQDGRAAQHHSETIE